MKMNKVELLNKRLEEIGKNISETEGGVAFIALGSVGEEVARMDEYSDLDFFCVVENGYKERFIKNIDWLEKSGKVAYKFLNTVDGYKLMYEDGVFCEFAVFDLNEIERQHIDDGRYIWKREWYNKNILDKKPVVKQDIDLNWIAGEIMTNLYVGLCRFNRGEKMSAFRFIQNYPIDRLMELAEKIYVEEPTFKDKYSRDRRIEKRYPEFCKRTSEFMQGVEKSKESAVAILKFLEEHVEINQKMKEEILKLCR
jgi:lincosamide nucleotidyltransferase B/F